MTKAPQQETTSAHKEAFQPVPVTSPAANPWAFRLRCLVDLQLATIVQHLRPALASLSGQVIHVGAGKSTWRAWLPQDTRYHGIDVGYADDFGMTACIGEVTYYNGKIMPLADSSFDAALCI